MTNWSADIQHRSSDYFDRSSGIPYLAEINVTVKMNVLNMETYHIY